MLDGLGTKASAVDVVLEQVTNLGSHCQRIVVGHHHNTGQRLG
jgi:hypothetical protein